MTLGYYLDYQGIFSKHLRPGILIAMSIDNEQIKKLAYLARLEIPEERLDVLRKGFDSILAYIDQIESVTIGDISGFQEPIKNVMRDDDNAIVPGAYTETLLAEAPDREDNYVKINKVL